MYCHVCHSLGNPLNRPPTKTSEAPYRNPNQEPYAKAHPTNNHAQHGKLPLPLLLIKQMPLLLLSRPWAHQNSSCIINRIQSAYIGMTSPI